MAHQGIVLVKKFTYRNAPEEWSNVYHFSEAAPTTDSAWKALVDAVAALEKTIFTSSTHIVRAYCYADTDADSVYTVDYTALAAEIPGTITDASGAPAPGDSAAWVRWSTSKRNSKGKTVYLRKYYHGINTTTGQPDLLSNPAKTALLALGVALGGGTGHVTGFTICGPDGTAAGTAAISPYMTTRTLKRRGKRPPS